MVTLDQVGLWLVRGVDELILGVLKVLDDLLVVDIIHLDA